MPHGTRDRGSPKQLHKSLEAAKLEGPQTASHADRRLRCEWLDARCDHPIDFWPYMDPKNRRRIHRGPHAPILGAKRPDGSWATKAAGRYPGEFNVEIAKLAARAIALRPKGHGREVLHVFSGPTDRADGLRAILAESGVCCTDVDICNVELGLGNSDDHDLNRSDLWDRLLLRVQDRRYAFTWYGTPCETWSAARGRGVGPRALRSEAEPYGISHPSPPWTEKERTQLRLGTFYMQRTFLLARAQAAAGGGFGVESPEPREGAPSLFKTAEYASLKQAVNCQEARFDQCRYGAESPKPTLVAWHMPERPQPAATIPRPHLGVAAAGVKRPTPGAGERPESSKARRLRENNECIGGMRNPVESIRRCTMRDPAESTLLDCRPAVKVRKVLLEVARWPGVAEALDKGEAPPKEELDRAHRKVLQVLGAAGVERADWGVSAPLLRAWQDATHDPDIELPEWAVNGSLFGILEAIKDTGGIFPPTGHRVVEDAEVSRLSVDGEHWDNYTSAEDDPETVLGLLDIMVGRGWASEYDSVREMAEALGESEVPLNKLGLLSKQRADGSWKHRLVWDLRRSGVNEILSQGQRVVLPHLFDVASDILEVGVDDREVELVVLDVSDAFFHVRLNKKEQKFQGAMFRGRAFAFHYLIFGSAAAPTVWGRVAAWLGRSTQMLLPAASARMQIYVDDPLLTLAGTPAERRDNYHVAVLWWCCAGFALAWAKLSRGSAVDWVGARIAAVPGGAEISIPEKKVSEALNEVQGIKSRAMIPLSRLRKYAGRLSFYAGLVWQLRPFLGPLWSVIADCTSASTGERVRWVHTKRISWALDWHAAFFKREMSLLRRKFLRATSEDVVFFATDASPWGLGGVLFDSRGFPVQYFTSPLDAADETALEAKIGESKHMTLWEGLALLTALRLWVPAGTAETVRVSVKADSLGALLALAKAASKSPSLNRITMEMALDLAGMSSYLELTHIPGPTNVLPDALSRMSGPDPHVLPESLRDVHRVQAPPRTAQFWRTLNPP